MPAATLETPEARKYLEYAKDPAFTYEMARIFGNSEPAPARDAGYDRRLAGTGILAYYINPEEMVELYPEAQQPYVRAALREELGSTEPYIGLNPELGRVPREFADSVIKHEKSHGAQPKGKLVLKGIYARTPAGNIPLGEMFIEGWNEYGLERKGEKPPSRYFDEMHGYGKALYSQYRDFVYEIEQQSPGITRQIMRAAHRGGPQAAIRLIGSIPDIGNIIAKYAWKVTGRMN